MRIENKYLISESDPSTTLIKLPSLQGLWVSWKCFEQIVNFVVQGMERHRVVVSALGSCQAFILRSYNDL